MNGQCLLRFEQNSPLPAKTVLSLGRQGFSAVVMNGVKSLRLSLLMPINSNIGGTDFPCCYVLALLCTFIPQDPLIASPKRVFFYSLDEVGVLSRR